MCSAVRLAAMAVAVALLTGDARQGASAAAPEAATAGGALRGWNSGRHDASKADVDLVHGLPRRLQQLRKPNIAHVAVIGEVTIQAMGSHGMCTHAMT